MKSVSTAPALVVFFLATLFALPSLGQDVFKRGSSGMDGVRLAEAGALLQKRVENGDFSGGIVAVMRKGRLVYQSAHGYDDVASQRPFSADSIVRIFSMTKPVTAVAIMQLVDSGDILLTDPVSKYIPSFANMEVIETVLPGGVFLKADQERAMQIRDLLNHTSGLTYHFRATPLGADYLRLGIVPGVNTPLQGKVQPSLESMVDDLASLPLLAHPGEIWHYGVGLDVAGRVVEVVSGMSLAEYFRERIFVPLGMLDTAFWFSDEERLSRLSTLYSRTVSGGDYQPIDHASSSAWGSRPLVFAGGAGLLSTLNDYLKFTQMLLNDGALNKVQVLSPSSTSLLMSDNTSSVYGQDIYRQEGNTPSPELSMRLGDDYGMGYGLGGVVYTNRGRAGVPYADGTYSWGGAASTFFWTDPKSELAVVFMTQLLPVFILEPGEEEEQPAISAERAIDSFVPRIANLIYAAMPAAN